MNRIRLLVTEEEKQNTDLIEQMVREDDDLELMGIVSSRSEALNVNWASPPDIIIAGEAVPLLLEYGSRPGRKNESSRKRSLVRELPRGFGGYQNLLENRVTDLLHVLGVPAHVRGYYYLREAIIMAVQCTDTVGPVTKVLYPGIAGKFHTTTVRVERSIRHAIDITWSRGDITVLEDIFGYTVDSEKGRPSNSEFIAMVADRVRLEFRKELTKSGGPEEKANS